MKTVISILLPALMFTTYASSQITKGNWVLGGNASYLLTHKNSESYGGQKNTIYSLLLTPEVGYFFADKLSAGLKVSIDRQGYRTRGSTLFDRVFIYDFGPFVRYYFLPAENIVNLLVEGSYQYGLTGGQGKISSSRNIFAAAAGPVMYINSSLGLELLLHYSTYRFLGYSGSNRSITISAGIQAYLEKKE